MTQLSERQQRPDGCLTAELYGLSLESADPSGLSEFYTQAMGYSFSEQDGALVGHALDRRLEIIFGRSKTLAGASYRLPDGEALARLRERIDAAGWPREDGATRFFTDATTVSDPDGNRLSFGLGDSKPMLVNNAELGARLQHIVVASRAPEKIVDFVVNVLGFTPSDEVLDGDGKTRTVFLRSSHEHHSFAVFAAPEDRFDHHCYETRDWNAIRDWCDHFAARHIPVVWGPGRHGPGNNLFVFVHDPDGNWVELSAELEQVDHDRPLGAWPHEERTLNSWGRGLLRS